jgi:hypothetical protein
MKMSRARSTHGEKQNAYRILVGKPEEKTPLDSPTRRWEDNTKIDPTETECGTNWIHLAQDRDQQRALMNTVKKLRVS